LWLALAALVWQGRGQADLSTSGRLIGTDVERVALEAARAILERFPPRGGT